MRCFACVSTMAANPGSIGASHRKAIALRAAYAALHSIGAYFEPGQDIERRISMRMQKLLVEQGKRLGGQLFGIFIDKLINSRGNLFRVRHPITNSAQIRGIFDNSQRACNGDLGLDRQNRKAIGGDPFCQQVAMPFYLKQRVGEALTTIGDSPN